MLSGQPQPNPKGIRDELFQLYCHVDDFWQHFASHWQQQQLSSGQRQRQRSGQLHESEIMTILIHFHQQRTKSRLAEWGLSVGGNIEPLGYLDMLVLVEGAATVITDSGGLQKEAYFLYVPCVTVRPETEWIETVASGWNRLCAPLQADILAAVSAALTQPPAAHPDFYGDDNAAARIVEALESAPQSASKLR